MRTIFNCITPVGETDVSNTKFTPYPVFIIRKCKKKKDYVNKSTHCVTVIDHSLRVYRFNFYRLLPFIKLKLNFITVPGIIT